MIAAMLDTRRANRDFRRISRTIKRAETTALKRAGGNVRRAYIAGVRGRKTKALPAPVRKLDTAWRAILHPGVPLGGGLTQSALWPIHTSGNTATVDIVGPFRRNLERYQQGGASQLAGVILYMRRVVTNAMTIRRARSIDWGSVAAAIPYRQRGARRIMYAILDHIRAQGINPAIDAQGTLRALHGLPWAKDVPARDVVGPVRDWARRNLPDWYVAILRKQLGGVHG